MLLATLSLKAQDKLKNGFIYKDHPYIQTIIKLFEFGSKGDTLSMKAFYADSARFYQSPDYSETAGFETLNQVRSNWSKIYNQWEIQSMVKIGNLDGLEYENAPFTVKSSWYITAIFKKTHKKASFLEIVLDEFNKEGKITKESSYFDASSFKEAVLP